MKNIVSDIPGFTGTIEMKDTSEITLDIIETYLDIEGAKDISVADRREQLFDAVCAWTKIWHIEGQPPHPNYKTFVPIPDPELTNPYSSARALFKMVQDEVKRGVTGIQAIPNASGPGPTDTQKPATA
jgi:hypothetical protein